MTVPEPATPGGAVRLTVASGTNIAAAVHPGTRQLVLDLQGILWKLPYGGGAGTAITTAELDASRPAWSPDGRQLAFQAFKTGDFHIWTADAQGGNLRRLTEGPYDHRDPAWSPDGRILAFASDRADEGAYDIWTLDIDSGTLARRTSGPSNHYAPAWTPDGEIVFVEERTTLAKVDGAGQVSVLRVVDEPKRVERPAVSESGRVAYVVYPDADLYVDGLRVTSGEDVFHAAAQWVSDDRLLYTADGTIKSRDLAGGTVQTIPFEVELVVPRESRVARVGLLDHEADQPVKGLMTPRISPDGRDVLFVALNKLWRAGPDGSRVLAEPAPGHVISCPHWSADGQHVSYVTDEGGLPAVYRMALATGRVDRLTNHPGGAQFDGVLSPSGRSLAYQNQDHSIRVLDLETGEDQLVADPIVRVPRAAPVGPPSWSPDGRFVAFNDSNRINSRFREGYNQIRVVEVATRRSVSYSPLPYLSLSDRGDCGPAWSPDGRWMAVIIESELWVVPVDARGRLNGAPHRVVEESADSPSWTGDSQTLCYLSDGALRRVSLSSGSPRTMDPALSWKEQRPAGTVRMRVGQLWDGDSESPLADRDILIDGNRIVGVEPRRSRPAADERLLDFSDRTVIPGLWEAHNHPTGSPESGGRYFNTYLAYGITGNLSLGSFAYPGLNQRESLLNGSMVGPRHFLGELLDGSRIAHPSQRAHATERAMRRSLDRAAALGLDYMKVYVRAPFSMLQMASAFGHQRLGVPSGTHMLAPGAMAGMDMIAHLSATQRLDYSYSQSVAGKSYDDVRQLLTTGGQGLMATPFDAMALIAEDHTILTDPRVTTLMPPWYVDDIRKAGTTNQPSLDILCAETQFYVEIVNAGGSVMTGTDAPIMPPGLMVHLVLRAMVKYGMSPVQALRTATVNTTDMLGIGGEVGRISPGYLADLTVIDGDPFDNFDDLIKTGHVVKNGMLFTQEDFIAPFAR